MDEKALNVKRMQRSHSVKVLDEKNSACNLSQSEKARNILTNNMSGFVQNTTSLRNLLNTSKGRDKFCQLLQYLANLYITCMKQSSIWGPLVKQGKVESFTKLKNFESQISNGRKIFRLGLWLNELSNLYDISKS